MSRHIVVVEDDSELLNVVCGALRQAGFMVTGTGGSGRELSALIHPPSISILRVPDVYFIDLDLRKGDGLKIAQSLCRGSQDRTTIVAMSGHSTRVREAVRSDLFHLVLAKPVDLEELVGALSL